MHLGVDQQSGIVYEGLEGPVLPVVPRPMISQCKLIKAESDWSDLPTGIASSPTYWTFREDSFDPVTRTRRGRLYEPNSAQPAQYRVMSDPYEDPFGRSVGAQGRVSKSLFSYKACSELLREPRRGVGLKIAIGTRAASSAWRIVQTEVVVNGCVMITLKSLSAFDIIPIVDIAKIPEEFRQSVVQTLDRVLDAAFRENPISVIDRCRNAMAAILSRWLVASGHDATVLTDDLGKVATIVGAPPYEKAMVSNLARTVARLHSRGKTNEAHAKRLRDPVEADAELAVQALGFALRDIGWADLGVT